MNATNLPPNLINALLAHAVTSVQRSEKAQQGYNTPDGIIRFVREVLHADPAPYQERILRAFAEHKKVAVRGPHGLGKTALAAWVTLWGMYAFTDDVKIITTASAWRQLTHYLWVEIRKWARKCEWDGERPRILDTALKMTGKEAFAVASDDPALIEGAHAHTLIYILDESKAIPDPFWDAIEGAFSGAGEDTDANAYALSISTPGTPSGRFYDIHARRAGLQDWHVEHVTLEEAIAAKRISRTWAEQRKEQWGEASSVYQNRVLGNFAESGEDSVIPLAHVEAAVERWHACKGKGAGTRGLGVDPARYGTDKTAIADVVGNVCEKITYSKQEDLMQTTGRVASAAPDKDTAIGVDVIGLGAGVFDRLRELKYRKAKPITAGARTDLKDASGEIGFVNLRSALWWMLRERLDPTHPEPLAIPDDDLLIGDLVAPTFRYTSKGQIEVESKDDIRKRLKRSTDSADALALAVYVNSPHFTQVQRVSFGTHSGYNRSRTRTGFKKNRRPQNW